MLLALRSVYHKGLTMLCLGRFMNVPRSTMEKELKAQEKELSDDITNLNKKVEFCAFHFSFVVSTICSQSTSRNSSMMLNLSCAISYVSN